MARWSDCNRALSALILALGIAAPATAQQVVVVESDSRAGGIVIGGTVIPYREVTLSAQIPGRVEFLAGEEGQRARKDAVLVSVDDDDLLAQRQQALAHLGQAEAVLRNAHVQYQRELWSPRVDSLSRAPGMGLPTMFDQFFTRNFGSWGNGNYNHNVERQADLHAQGAQVNEAQARALAARSAIDELDARLRDTRSVAPFDGVIVQKLVEPGDTVQPGQPLMVYAQTDYLRIRADIPTRLMGGLERGMLLPARLDIGDTRVEARVSQIYPVADPTRHTVTVKFDLPAGVPGGPGMYAEVTIPDPAARTGAVPVIPKAALLRRGSLPSVFVLDNQDRASLRVVRIGVEVGDDRVAVLSGLRIGERVIVDPPSGIRSGWSPFGETAAQTKKQ